MSILSSLLAACAGKPPTNLGVHDNRLAACPSAPRCVSSQETDERHHIAPLAFSGDADAAFARLKQILARRKDTRIIGESSGYLRVEMRTNLFVDDGEFLLDRSGGIIHVRSSSRVGYWDMGKNRRRMEDIRSEFNSTKAAL